MEDFINELWIILHSDESEENRIAQAKELVTEFSDESGHDLPEILEFDLGEDEDDY